MWCMLAVAAMWCMLAAPLLAGNDLTKMSDQTLAILTAPELIALNQDALVHQAVVAAEEGAPSRVPYRSGSTHGRHRLGDVGTAAGQTEYHRIIDRNAEFGSTHIVYEPTNSLRGSRFNTTDGWGCA